MPTSDVTVEIPVASGQSCSLERSIWSWVNAYKVSLSIFALNELGVLGFIAGNFLSPGQIASQLGLNEELLAPLLELLASVGVLQKNDAGFRAPRGIETILPLLALESRLNASHVTASQIARVVRTGEAADIFQSANLQEYIPVFASAMRSSARTLAPHLLRFGNIRQSRHVLDLGGADGSLALALRRVAPHLSLTVVDLPRMQAAFEKQVNEHGAGEAIQFHPADLRHPETLAGIVDNADIILISNVIHLLTIQQRMDLYRSIRESMAAGARFLIYDQFIDYVEPFNAPHFMVVDWVINGVQFRETPQELCEILGGLGFSDVQYRRFSGLPGAVIAAQV